MRDHNAGLNRLFYCRVCSTLVASKLYELQLAVCEQYACETLQCLGVCIRLKLTIVLLKAPGSEVMHIELYVKTEPALTMSEIF